MRVIRSALGGAAVLIMRQLYVTMQDCFLVEPLLRGEEDALRAPFRVLLQDTAVSELVDLGAPGGTWHYYGRRGGLGSKLPFVPGLGALRLRAKAQVEHRAIRHDYGHSCFPPEAIGASTTGIRANPSTEELVSHWPLSDTYRSPRSLELDARMAAEGAVDSYVSDAESTWHLAFSIEPRKRISVRPTSVEAEALQRRVDIQPRAYIHLYPYGGVSVILAFSLTFARDQRVSEVLPLLKALLGRRGRPQFQLEVRRAKPKTAPELIAELGRRTAAAILASPDRDRAIKPDYALSLAADPAGLSDAEVAGLLTLDDHYEEIREGWMQARASLYGKYSGDRLTASRGSLAVVTSPRQFTPSGRRRFFWRCHAIKEFARLQALTLEQVASELRRVGAAAAPRAQTLNRMVAVGEHLCEFHRGLPAHHRKWFYECEAVVGGEEARRKFRRAVAELHSHLERAAMMRRMEESGGHHFHIIGSQIGVLNLGTILGDVESNLTVIDGQEAEDMRSGLTEFVETVLNENELGGESKRELIEAISLLSEEAAKQAPERRGTVVTSVMQTVGTLSATVGSVATAWLKLEPVLRAFFG